MNRPGAIVIGDAAVDTRIQLPDKDVGVGTLKDIRPDLSPGGTVGNTAVALARIGVKVGLVFAVGADGYGDYLKQALSTAGVDIHHVQVVPGRFTLNVIVIIDQSGERYFAVHPADGAASLYYPPAALDLDSLRAAGWLHVSGSGFEHGTTRHTVLKAMAWAKESGVPVSLDLNLRPQTDSLSPDYQETVDRALHYADYVLGSATDEFTLYTGLADGIEAARLVAAGQRTVVARLGHEGCLVITPAGTTEHIPAFTVPVVDTLGAGDVFNAGFIAAGLAGQSVLAAARWGNALAALSVAAAGAAQHLTPEGFAAMLGASPNDKS